MTDDDTLGVMQLSDTLRPGGQERIALNLANSLPRERFRSFLCTTRGEGALAARVLPHVGRLLLARRSRYDLAALRRLVRHIREHRIRVLHAHGSSLFLAVLASHFKPSPAVIWHDQFGLQEIEQRPVWLYRLAARRVAAVIACTEALARWWRSHLPLPPQRIRYVPNFVIEARSVGTVPKLPGRRGARIVCVAHLRPQKDHLTLLQAMEIVVREVSSAHLILVGSAVDPSHFERIQATMTRDALRGRVSWLGCLDDVPSLLLGCDIGVSSSGSEGMPLALIEYGRAGLAVVATRVGQCAEVLDEGRAGRLVSPRSPQELAHALIALLRSPACREDLGTRLSRHVRERYDASRILEQICDLYDVALH